MDINAHDTTANQLSYVKIQAYPLQAGAIGVNIVDGPGTILASGAGRTLGRALFQAALMMVDRDALDFMDAVNSQAHTHAPTRPQGTFT